jgi:hypothetical protein
MTDKKIDITSTAVEKGLDIAKDFLDKLIIPTVEETGLLLRDKVTMWRFSNQVRMLNKAKAYCEKNGIDPKKVSLKVLCPLLDYAGLEENEVLQDKWALLLSNMVDSGQNIENHVFPYILSQISTNEFVSLETTVVLNDERIKKLKDELEQLKKIRPEREQELRNKIEEIAKQLRGKTNWRQEQWTLHQEQMKFESELRGLLQKETKIAHSIAEDQYLSGQLELYEIANMTRLGLIKEIQKSFGYINRHKIRNDPDSEYLSLEDAEVEIQTEYQEYIPTELGVLFIRACTEKKPK